MAKSNEKRIRLANDEIVGKGNLEIVDQFFASDYIAHAGGKDHQGLAFIKRFGKQLRAAMPDLSVVALEIRVEAGDLVAWERTLRGTHQADMMGIPPSGKKVQWCEMVVTRFEGEKIAEEWVVSDLAGQLLLILPRA